MITMRSDRTQPGRAGTKGSLSSRPGCSLLLRGLSPTHPRDTKARNLRTAGRFRALVSQSTRAPEEDARRYVEVAEHFWVIVKKEALRRFISVFSYSERHIKAEKKSNRRRGDAEVRGGKGSFFPTNIFPSSDLRVSASPRLLFDYFFFGYPRRWNPEETPQSQKKSLTLSLLWFSGAL